MPQCDRVRAGRESRDDGPVSEYRNESLTVIRSNWLNDNFQCNGLLSESCRSVEAEAGCAEFELAVDYQIRAVNTEDRGRIKTLNDTFRDEFDLKRLTVNTCR